MRKCKFKSIIASVLTPLLFLTLFTIPAPPVLAQTANTGVLTGVVQNEKGEVVANALVRAVNIGTNATREARSSDEGVYEITQLVPGTYRIEVEAQGFAKSLIDNVSVNVLQRTTVNPTLKVGALTETVNVTAENSPLVETTKTDVSGVVDQRRLENLPVNGRSFASLAILIPGATLQPSFDPTKARTGTFSVGGSTGRNVNVTIDGGDNKDNAVGGILQNFTMEGIQEFSLSTQRFSAANGRSGGALLSVVSKSGTNEWHGTGFGFFRSDKLNANAPRLLAKANPTLFADPNPQKPPFNRQQFGGSIGGPLKHDKAFFFGAVERTRERGNSLVPADVVRQIGLLESQVHFGFKPVSLLPQPFDDTQYTLKGDFHLNQKHTLLTRFAGQNNDSLNDQAGFLIVKTDLTGGNQTLNRIYSFLASDTWVPNASVVNQFAYQYQSFNNRINATSNIRQVCSADGICVGQNGNVPQQTVQHKHQFRDDFSWNRGNHGFKFGGDFVWTPKLGGIFAFLSGAEYDLVDTIDAIATDKVSYPQGFFTPGVAGDILIAGGDPSFLFRQDLFQWSAYAQDDWKVSPRLTLNLGLRYDVDLGYLDSANQDKNRTRTFLRIIGHPYGSLLPKDDKNNFSPRVGFAWDIGGNARSVMRGGYGLYYDQTFQNVTLFAIQLANPEIYAFITQAEGDESLATPLPAFPRPLTNPPLGNPINGRLIDPFFVSPYTQQWNLGFAQELGKNMALEFDYVHILGLHEFTQSNFNPRIGPLVGAQRTSPSQPRLLAPLTAAHSAELIAEFGQQNPFTNIRVAQSDGRSRYDAFTVAFRKRYSEKYQLNAHYTLSRTVGWFGQVADFGVQPQNPFFKFDPAADFGYTNEDERHRFVVSGVFDLPHGFQLSPVFQIASARPYSILPDPGTGAGGDINRDGVANDRETRDGNDQHKLPPATQRGDMFSQMNLRVSKFFNFGERKKLGLFFETFNLFNTSNFGNSFQNVKGSPDFGKPVNFFGATGFSEPIGIPFQAQIGARFTF
ncbi:MAG: hypothetical protein QOD00_2789 [Blastocatellia bacterium]|nr:hypothetical protein [Blastocatellia bacterium]